MKFRKRELWLLAVPLLAVIGLGGISYLPGLRQSYDDQQFYGAVQPRLILRPYAPHVKRANGILAAQWCFPLVTVSPNSNLIATGAGAFFGQNPHQPVKIWDAHDGHLITNLRPKKDALQLAFDRLGTSLLIAQGSVNPNYVEQWRIPEVQLVHTFTYRNGNALFKKELWHRIRTSKFFEKPLQKIASRNDAYVTLQKQEFAPQSRPANPHLKNTKYFHLTFIFHPKKVSRARAFPFVRCDTSCLMAARLVVVTPHQIHYQISQDGKSLFVLFAEEPLRVGDYKHKYWLECFVIASGRCVWRKLISPSYVARVTLSPNASLLAFDVPTLQSPTIAQFSTINIISARSGKTLLSFRSWPAPQDLFSGRMQFSPDSKTLLVPCDDRLELWDVSNLR